MGLSGISLWQLLILLLIVVLLFGTRKLKNLGTDLGSAVSGFRKAAAEENPASDHPAAISRNSELEDRLNPGNINRSETV